MVDTVTIGVSSTTLAILYDAKSGSDLYNAEAADLTIQIYSIAQSTEAYKLSPGFVYLASEVASGLAFAFLCTPQPDKSCMFLLIKTLRSIERFAKKRLSQARLRRLWGCVSDRRKIAAYREGVRTQLVVFGLQLDLSTEENLSRMQTARKKHNQTHATPGLERNMSRFPERSEEAVDGYMLQDSSLTSNGRSGESATQPSASTLLLNHGQHQTPSRHTRVTMFSPPHHQPESRTSVATGPPLSLSVTPHNPFLVPQINVFFIDNLTANITNRTANHHSGNVSTTTVANSANNSSRRSAMNLQ